MDLPLFCAHCHAEEKDGSGIDHHVSCPLWYGRPAAAKKSAPVKAAQRHQCSYMVSTLHSGSHQCPYTATWGFQHPPDPYAVNYGCNDHLGHLMSRSVTGVEPVIWSLDDGFDAYQNSAEEIAKGKQALG